MVLNSGNKIHPLLPHIFLLPCFAATDQYWLQRHEDPHCRKTSPDLGLSAALVYLSLLNSSATAWPKFHCKGAEPRRTQSHHLSRLSFLWILGAPDSRLQQSASVMGKVLTHCSYLFLFEGPIYSLHCAKTSFYRFPCSSNFKTSK